MSLKNLFLFIFNHDYYMSQIQKKILELENQIQSLKASINIKEEPEKGIEHKQKQQQSQPPIIVEKINIERLFVDKYELNNTFGQLGIKELKGKLYIGATYGTGVPFPLENIGGEDDEKMENKPRPDETKKNESPKVNIKGKTSH